MLKLQITNSPMNAVKLDVSYSASRDHDIWQDLKAGVRSAVDRIYDAHGAALMAYGRQFTGNSSLIDDCIQDLFIDLWIKRDRLGDTTSIRFYLLKSLKHRILRSLKKEEKKASFDLLHDTFPERFSSQSVEDSGVDEARLLELINGLSSVQREIIFLKFFNGLSFDEIGEVLQLNKKQIYNALAKAMNKLRSSIVLFVAIIFWILL